MKIVAVLPEGLEEEGVLELNSLGAESINKSRGIVKFEADLACFYRLHFQARLPFRFLREVSQFTLKGKESLYDSIQNAFDWKNWLNPSKSFRVDVSGVSEQLRHTHFTALQVKNALVDLQRSIWGKRSNIDLISPDICIHLHLHYNNAILSLDSSSNSLHRRGYRSAMGIAPLKENIASGLLMLSNWDDSLSLVDPLCGSATFLIEAVSIARYKSPGLNRSFLFENWPDFDKKIFSEEMLRARHLFSPNKKLPRIVGFEVNSDIANQAIHNINQAGFDKDIEINIGHFSEVKFPQSPGIIVCNPPYGKRVGKSKDLQAMYKEFGAFLKNNASGWDLWLLNGNPTLSSFLGMKCSKRIPISNGGIDCRWLHYQIH